MTSESSGSCWPLMSAAVFVPNSASWVLLQQPGSQEPQYLFLSPMALCLSPSRLTFPLPGLSFSYWVHDPGHVPPTILFAAIRHVPSQQVRRRRVLAALPPLALHACMLYPKPYCHPRSFIINQALIVRLMNYSN